MLLGSLHNQAEQDLLLWKNPLRDETLLDFTAVHNSELLPILVNRLQKISEPKIISNQYVIKM